MDSIRGSGARSPLVSTGSEPVRLSGERDGTGVEQFQQVSTVSVSTDRFSFPSSVVWQFVHGQSAARGEHAKRNHAFRPRMFLSPASNTTARRSRTHSSPIRTTSLSLCRATATLFSPKIAGIRATGGSSARACAWTTFGPAVCRPMKGRGPAVHSGHVGDASESADFRGVSWRSNRTTDFLASRACTAASARGFVRRMASSWASRTIRS